MSIEASNKSTICLLPGLGGSGELFRWLNAALADHYDTKVVVYPNAECLDDFVQAASQQIPDDRPVHIVAESFSGPIAIKLLATMDMPIVSCTLCNTFSTPPWAWVLPLINRMPTAMLAASRFSNPILRWWVGGGYSNSSQSQSQKWISIMHSVNTQDRSKTHNQLRALRGFEVTALLSAIKVPVLYLQGNADRLIRSVHGRRIAAALKCCRVEIVPGPHLLLQLAAPECAKLIHEHIESAMQL